MQHLRISWRSRITVLACVIVGAWLWVNSTAGAARAAAAVGTAAAAPGPVAQGYQGPGQDHSGFSVLTGPFKAPQEVTAACLTCHYTAADEVMATVHWTWEMTDPVSGQTVGKQHVINNYCMAIAANEPRCTSCHAGYGFTDATFFETATQVDVDCLVCHDTTGTYKKFPTGAGYPVLSEPREFPAGSGKIWSPVDLTLVAQNVGSPSRTNCGNCHFTGGGGDAVKHGDLDTTLSDPARELDVHMAPDGLDFSCVSCHGGAADHQIAGRLYNGQEPLLCESCHSGARAPHQESSVAAALGMHTETVACQTCHIPTFARGQATKMSWDWSTAGQLDDAGKPYITKDEQGHVVYDSQKGTFTWESNVVPAYRWWNGEVGYLTVNDRINPNTIVPITAFGGALGDGKLYPFKHFTGTQPYDVVNNTLVVPNLFPNNAGDTGAYWRGWDWQSAIVSGMAAAGADYSGEFGWVDTEMFWVQNHMVAPSENALRCADCHTSGGRLNFTALGYEPARAAFLSTLAAPRAGSAPPHQNLTQYSGPETCLTCHPGKAEEVMTSIHYTWLGAALEVDEVAVTSTDLVGMGSEICGPPASVTGLDWLGLLQPQNANKPAVPGGCAQYHVGFGAKPNSPGALTAADAQNVDCLLCHGPDYARTVAEVDGNLRMVPAEGVNLLEVVQNVQPPTNDMCLRCHLSTGEGPNYKHSVSLASPGSDVHLAAGLQCVDCHKVENHRFGGSADLNGVDRPDLIMGCTDCHQGSHPVGFTAIDRHLDRVACQTCHIPEIARDAGYPTLIAKDWTQALLQENGLYAPQVTLAGNVTPIYRWSNGRVQSYPPEPTGTIEDAEARLYPWKYLESVVPVDPSSGGFLPISAGVYAITGDLNAAVVDGAAAAKVAYSGNWEAKTDRLLFSLNHQVAPASEALRCPDCHTRDIGRINFAALGYDELRAADLVRTNTTASAADRMPFGGQTVRPLEEKSYAADVQAIAQSRERTQKTVLAVTAGVVVGLLLAVVLAFLVLRSRGVTPSQMRGWLRDHRPGVTAILLVVVVSGLVGFVSIHYLFEFTASTAFCGEICHANRPEAVTHNISLHANVACVECHVGPGLERELQAKLNGIRELYLEVTNTYERPIPSPVETLRPARDVCEHCHWPEVFYADRAIEIAHFNNDEDNSRENTYMLLKIGGGTERRGQGQGIHWHIENKVEYIATDPQRQNIPWVRAELNGQTFTFIDVTSPLSEAELAESEIREMDCIDCHNRASHVFRSTDEMLDEALAYGVLPTDLPYLRREAWTALENPGGYEAVMEAIDAIPAFYQKNYPDIYETRQDALAHVVNELRNMVATSNFPEAKVNYRTYPDNLAHSEDPGCFRCHDGKHYVQDPDQAGTDQVSSADQSIRLHCTICHTIPQTVAEGKPAPLIPFHAAWQPDTHLASTWIADHRYTFDETCNDCHEEQSFCANSNCHGRSWPTVNLSVSTPPFPLQGD